VRHLGFIAALVFTAAGCGLCGDDRDASAVLEQVQPSVTIAPEGGEPAAAAEGATARAGDTVTTDDKGTVQLRFPGGGTVKLEPTSSVFIEGGAEGLRARRVRLLFGTIDATGAGANLLVMTTLGPIKFGDAESSVTISSGDDGVTVRTLLGEVQMGDQTVGAGVTVHIDSGGIFFDQPVDAGALEDAGGVAELGTTGPVVILLESGGSVRRKPEGKKRFVRVKVGTPLMQNDQVEVRSGRATLALGEIGQVKLGRRARVGIGGPQIAGAAPLFEAQRGTAAVVLAKGARQSVGLGAVRAEISGEVGGADVEFTRDRSSSKVRVYAGRVVLIDGAGKRTEVPANQVATINAKGESRAREVGSESLQINAGVRRILTTGRLPAVTFTWKALPDGGPYTIEIAKDASFTKLVTVAQIQGTGYTTDRLSLGSYHWRVRNQTKTNPGRTVSFGRDRSSASTDARKNLVRASGERTVILYQQFRTPQLTFRWPAREDAKKYRISVYADGKFDSPQVEKVTKEPSMQLTAGQLKDGRYLWAVSSLSADGKVASTSDMFDLEVKYDSNEMLLRVLVPPVGARVAGKTVETRGMVPPGAKLSVNGKAVQPDQQGRFKAQVEVPKGAPYLIYRIGSVLFVRPVRR